jgi:hypothetical protein
MESPDWNYTIYNHEKRCVIFTMNYADQNKSDCCGNQGG